MSPSPQSSTPRLLPSVRELARTPGTCFIGPDSPVTLRVDDARVARAVLEWRAAERHIPIRAMRFSGASGSALTNVGTTPDTKPEARPQCPILVAVDNTRWLDAQGYRLTVTLEGIDLLGGSAAGCFHGLQTLSQLAQYQAGPPTKSFAVPCCKIVDWPDLGTRGLLCDVTRGRVPHLATLKNLVDRLAALKVNQLQLYIEHAFGFSFDPEICGPDDGFTPEEIRDLDGYCRDRFIDLVPALATFGHMGRVLSMPKYRHLAEVEPTTTWEAMSWPQRTRGLTLDCMNPQAHRLVEQMWTDVLDAFSAPVVNICGDEPWDLGEGKNRDRFARTGKVTPYLEQLQRTHNVCAAAGRRTQFWSDVVRPAKLDPGLHDWPARDSTVLHWGYDDQADYAGTAVLVANGMDTMVCPGTSGWKRILNAMDFAERNIAAFAAAGREHGAGGLLNTDWGDHGHFNMSAGSLHGIALGAALGWNVSHPTAGAFDELFASVLFGTDDTSGVTSMRDASRVATKCETWRMLWTPLDQIADDPTLPLPQEIAETRRHAREALGWLNGLWAKDNGSRRDFEELALACRFTEIFAEKALFAHQIKNAPGEFRRAQRDRISWAEKLADAATDYAECWRLHNKESGLKDILRALTAAGRDVATGEH